ncbi:hypothetical protein [Aerococcus urinaeequi]|uniref:hypothetical protein n=1 Tax=Aerococcus urinaeequi TaxID=51665 RepID=UPI00366B6D53
MYQSSSLLEQNLTYRQKRDSLKRARRCQGTHPDILANEFLKVIKANDVANIQLQANSLVPETLTSFNDKVKVAIANPTQRKRAN